MEMETVRLANVSWFSIPDRQVLALRAAWSSWNGSRGQTGVASDNEPRRLPILDWPAALFDDEMFCH
jgi:hypothetical protein